MPKPTSARPIRDATQGDKGWVGALFRATDIIGGAAGWNLVWYRFWNGGVQSGEHWIVCEPAGFCHYKIRKRDGVKVVYEMAVSPEHRRGGHATALLDAIGRPLSLKTDADNEASNAFYRSYGMMCVGQTFTKAGKAMNVYQAW